uniref:Alpha/beta hydrolases superfamily protein n=1 Tax=Tanacetum cinerariifolium TaxID=118510 RepID=A0A6L2N709_TANCI|nr:alpha/beta hydrolases superfamily protein [Tanacetum cinerariifolium]
MVVGDFKKFLKRRGRFVRQPRNNKKTFQRSRDDKNGKNDKKCFRCGDPNHLIGECPNPPKDENQRAFVGGSWSDSGEEDDYKVNNETCLVAQASSEELLSHKKQGHDQSSSSTSTLPQAFKIGESSRKTNLKQHEKQIKGILNHLDEISLDRIEHIKDKMKVLVVSRPRLRKRFGYESNICNLTHGSHGSCSKEGEGVVVTSSSLEMLTNSCLGKIMVSLIFLEGLEEEALVEFIVELFEEDEDGKKNEKYGLFNLKARDQSRKA